jgi:photosynthetic reaction center cytochrome c subunit
MPGSRIALAITAVCLLGTATARGQAGPMAEEVFKNVEVLKGIPVKEFMGTMGFFSAATGMNCIQCHVEESAGNWARYADDTDLKRTARRMMAMVNSINQSWFRGQRVVTCYSCHRGGARPMVIPDLTEQYSDPILRVPDEILRDVEGAPSATQILDKYVQAVGGMQRLATLTSFVGKGDFEGYDDFDKYPVEIYAKAPDQRTTISHGVYGDSTSTYDGRNGWVAAPDAVTPVPILPLTKGDLDGARVEAELAFPARLKQTLTEWRVGPPFTIDDREVYVVQGKLSAGGLPIKLFFDQESGLLVRLVYYADTAVGRIPTQVDYADYRDVSGIKMPFKLTRTWTDGRSIIELRSVELNASIDAAKFAKPAPPGTPLRSAPR